MKNFNKTFLAVLAASAFACVLMTSQAHATMIVGDIGFFGSGSGSTNGVNSTLTFSNPMAVFTADGDYTGTVGQTANFANITWTGTGLGAVLTSAGQEWMFSYLGTSYSFNLNSLNNASIDGTSVVVDGDGMLLISGAINRDPTSASFAVQGTGSGFHFTILTASNSALPDGGSAVALLGISLAGVEFLRRKLRAA